MNINKNELNMFKSYHEYLHNSINQPFLKKKEFLNADSNNNGNIASKNISKPNLINENKESCEEEDLKSEIIKTQREAVIVCPPQLQKVYNNEIIYRPIPRSIITDSSSSKSFIDDKHILEQIILHRKNPENVGLLTFVDNNKLKNQNDTKPNINPYKEDLFAEVSDWERENFKTRMAFRRTSAPGSLWSSQPGFLKPIHSFAPQVIFLNFFLWKIFAVISCFKRN